MFFFFKQKTAYEMRISDWSSDVCSSDLDNDPQSQDTQSRDDARHYRSRRTAGFGAATDTHPASRAASCPAGSTRTAGDRDPRRSEEHTSELQSLMRISYAVFCLKKKKKTITQTLTQSHIYNIQSRHNQQT